MKIILQDQNLNGYLKKKSQIRDRKIWLDGIEKSLKELGVENRNNLIQKKDKLHDIMVGRLKRFKSSYVKRRKIRLTNIEGQKPTDILSSWPLQRNSQFFIVFNFCLDKINGITYLFTTSKIARDGRHLQ